MLGFISRSFVLIFLFSNICFANEPAKAPKKTFSGKTIKELPPEEEGVEADSSEALREGKKFTIVAQPIGGVGSFYVGSITFGYYLRPDLIAEFDRARGEQINFIYNPYIDIYSLRLKKFWGNSFYSNLGVAYREVGFSGNGGFFNTGVDGQYYARTLNVDIAIGNRWQWDNFTLGCDWVGLLVPFALIKEKDSYPAVTSSALDDSDRRELHRNAKGGMQQVLRFYLGVSW